MELATVLLLLILMPLGLSCTSLMPFRGRPVPDDATVLGVQHSYSTKPSDCLKVCIGMVLQYYNVMLIVPDTVMPMDLVSVSHRLNTATSVDRQGHTLFATVVEMTPEEVLHQLTLERPLIIAYKPSARAEYHSVVVSGYGGRHERYCVNDPARRNPQWRKLTQLRTFRETGKYLVLLIGLREP
jgi:hypothetical protein